MASYDAMKCVKIERDAVCVGESVRARRGSQACDLEEDAAAGRS